MENAKGSKQYSFEPFINYYRVSGAAKLTLDFPSETQQPGRQFEFSRLFHPV